MYIYRVNFVADPSLTAQIASAGSLFSLFTGLSTEDLPLVIGFPPDCTDFSCGVKYRGPLESDALAAFIADSLLLLPQVKIWLASVAVWQRKDFRRLALGFSSSFDMKKHIYRDPRNVYSSQRCNADSSRDRK